MTRAYKIIFVSAIMIGLIFASFVTWNKIFIDDNYRGAMYHSGEYKVIIHDFRSHFNKLSGYEAKDLADLHTEGAISDHCYDYIQSRWHAYYPFAPSTPNTAVVIRLGPPIFGDYIHKGDLVAGINDPDIIIK